MFRNARLAAYARRALLVAVLALAIAGVVFLRAVPASGAGNTLTTVDSSDPYSIFGTSIAVGADGLPVMSYSVAPSGDLKVAHCGNATCSAGNTLTTIPGAQVSGRASAIGVGTDGLPFIVSNDGSPASLRLIHCGDVDCTGGNTSATIGGNASARAIAVGADGLPVIAYESFEFPSDYSPLFLIHCGNQTCTSSNTLATVDAMDASNLDVSVAIGSDGFPVISYISQSYDLRVAHCGSANCLSGNTLATVDSSGSLGFYASIAVGTDGLPVISYEYDATRDLNVAHCGNATCTAGNSTVTVDSADDVGWYPSIAIGVDGLPVISYLYATYGDLRVAHCGNAACGAGNAITTVDNTPYKGTGFETSIAIGADGLPVVSYIDITNNSLKVLHCSTPACTDTKLPTPTPTDTPTNTPTPPAAVGGISLDPKVPGSFGGDAGLLVSVIARATASAIALGGAVWYARRRRAT